MMEKINYRKYLRSHLRLLHAQNKYYMLSKLYKLQLTKSHNNMIYINVERAEDEVDSENISHYSVTRQSQFKKIR